MSAQTQVHTQDGKRWWHYCKHHGEQFATHALWRVHMSQYKHSGLRGTVRRQCDGFNNEYDCPGLEPPMPERPGYRPSGKRVGQHRLGYEIETSTFAEVMTNVEAILDATNFETCNWGRVQRDMEWCGKEILSIELPPHYGGNWHAVVTNCRTGHRVRWDADDIAHPKMLEPGEEAFPKRDIVASLPPRDEYHRSEPATVETQESGGFVGKARPVTTYMPTRETRDKTLPQGDGMGYTELDAMPTAPKPHVEGGRLAY